MTSQDKSLETIFETFSQQANSLLVGSHSILDSFKLGFMFQVVGTTFRTLILETNPFLVRTNGFTADLAFVGNRETQARTEAIYYSTSQSFRMSLQTQLLPRSFVFERKSDGKLG